MPGTTIYCTYLVHGSRGASDDTGNRRRQSTTHAWYMGREEPPIPATTIWDGVRVHQEDEEKA